jgi:hypothetical protein
VWQQLQQMCAQAQLLLQEQQQQHDEEPAAALGEALEDISYVVSFSWFAMHL